jgi:dolichyl-phosphate-mannose--protein O-mannosyl transferase
MDALPPGATASGLAEESSRLAGVRARLVTPMPDDRLRGWIGPLLVTLFAAVLRAYRLSVPDALTFDETFYAKDAWSILRHGVEVPLATGPNGSADVLNSLLMNTGWLNSEIIAGQTSIFARCGVFTRCTGDFVVQPPAGKLLIAVGEWAYGLTTLGWRIAPAVAGSLAVLLMCRVTRRLTRSTLLGCAAGLLLSLDGLEFVLSRTGMLDIFLMLFVLASFGCLVADRDAARARLARRLAAGPGDGAGPGLGIRWWRVAAGVAIGLAGATKQDALWYDLAFAGLCVAWDAGARRAAGLPHWLRGGLLRDGKWLPLTLGLIPLVTYVATWSGWFFTNAGYGRNYAQSQGVNLPVVSALYSLLEYQKQIYQYMSTLSAPNPAQSQPWDWFVLSRPVEFYWQSYADAAGAHPVPGAGGPYVAEVLAIGNPLIWWAGIPATLFCLGWWATRRDWRAGAAVLGVLAGWATWLPYPDRTKYLYYALEFEPFMIICIVLCLGLIIGQAPRPVRPARPRRRAAGRALAGAYLLGAAVLFWYFYPVMTAEVIPHGQWLSRMWYYGWLYHLSRMPSGIIDNSRWLP